METITKVIENIDTIVQVLMVAVTIGSSLAAIFKAAKAKDAEALAQTLQEEKILLAEAWEKLLAISKNTEAKYLATVKGIEASGLKDVKDAVEKESMKLNVADDLHHDVKNQSILQEVYQRNKTVRTAVDFLRFFR